MDVKLHNIVSVFHSEPCRRTRHTHPLHEMVYCVEGENGSVEIEGVKHRFCTGNYYVVRADCVHAEYSRKPSKILYFHFEAPCERVINGAFADHDGTVLLSVRRLYRESGNLMSMREEMQESILRQILIEVLRASEYSHAKRDLYDVAQYLEEHLEEQIDLEALAERQNYSYDRFRHVFKESTGVSPYAFLLEKRLEKARFLMRIDPDASLVRIALSCGFSSSSQFANIFRSRYGINPSEYRKRFRES